MVEGLAAAAVVLQFAIAGLALVGARGRNVPAVVNAVIALAATFAPPALELALRASVEASVDVGALPSFWIAAAGFLHVLGMLGRYESTPWWDHVTHAISASFVAAVVHGCADVAVRAAPDLPLWGANVALGTVVFTLAVGVLWELAELVVHELSRELGVESLLVPYGRRDAALDLFFDVVGAVLVVALDVRLLVPVAELSPTLAGSALFWTTVLVALACAASGAFLFYRGRLPDRR